MKYLLLFSLMLIGCTEYKNIKSEGTKVTINGKECDLFMIDDAIRFIDCGPGSTSTNTSNGKTTQTVGQYVPPPPVAPVSSVLPALDHDTTCVCKSNKK